MRGSASAQARPSVTERGLDVWIHVTHSAMGGGTLPIDVRALGFPTATTVAPIPGATVEATWDPESLVDPTSKDPKPSSPPATVTATADADGRATLNLPVPQGAPRALKLLVSVRTGERERVREVTVARTLGERLDLFVSDTRVVPGSEVVAWVLWMSSDRSRPVPNQPVEFVLLQGGLVRHRAPGKTDAAGAALVRMPIPRDDAPGGRYQLRVRPAGRTGADASSLSDEVGLFTREETPGSPQLEARFEEGRVAAGGKAKLRVVVKDASGEGIATHPVWIWSGPSGTSAPNDAKEFEKAAKRHETDGAGIINVDIAAPTTIPIRGTTIQLEARTEIEGLEVQAKDSVAVGERRGRASLTAEGGELVPGTEQRLVIELSGDDDKALVGTFTAKGDGLDATFTTNTSGEAEVTWKVPVGIGALRQTGPCPGSVAAQVTLRAKDAGADKGAFGGALADASGMPLCVPVRRDATILARPEKLVIREGEPLGLRVLGAEKKAASVLLVPEIGGQGSAHFVADAGQVQSLALPKGAWGTVTAHVAVIRADGSAESTSTSVVVVPARLPNVRGSVTGGRAAPGGKVTITAELTDDAAKPMQGSIAAVVIDKLGGGTFGPLSAMDTRRTLCRELNATTERCQAALLGGAEMDPMRRAALSSSTAPIAPTNDPAADAKNQMDATFAAVTRSLEGAVFEASMSIETLPDVRRKEGNKYVFNPELMTLVTDAMSNKPLTPGGEPVGLSDLIAIDPQITYDNVARRVTRLKMFNVLSTMRTARVGLDPDEPILEEPNVFLRKLTREGSIGDADLLDPWGGQLSFFKANGEYVPFVSVRRGWELRSPGPDGKMGTGDDVKSPFERVVKSGTPYARAMNEDEVVDARYDMLVADTTVSNWSQTFLRATGTALGDSFGAGGLGLSGIGTGGGGQGFGNGSGRLGGRFSTSMPKGVAFVSPPMRTDAQGKVTIEIPLGDIETTWSVALIALPDEGRPAVGTVDVPSTVPMSAKVAAGAVWTDGDKSEAVLSIRNRTDNPLDVSLALAARGALQMDGAEAKKTVKVDKRGVTVVRVPVRAAGTGAGFLDVKATAAGVPDDTLTHQVEVRPRGELLRIARTTWATEEVDMTPALDRTPFVAKGQASLVLERGERGALEDALESLSPETATSNDDLAEIAGAARDLVTHFVAIEGDGSPRAERARVIGRAATAKVAARTEQKQPLAFSWLGRASSAGFTEPGEWENTVPDCPSPSDGLSPRAIAASLDAEPAPIGGAVRPCWTTHLAASVNTLDASDTPGSIAQASLALARRPHRATEKKTLDARLSALVSPDDEGNITLPSGSSRAERALVYAAVLVATDPKNGPRLNRLTAWLLVQRDAEGGFGSAAATRAAIQALIFVSSHHRGAEEPVEVAIDFGDGGEQTVTLKPGERKTIAVPANADEVKVEPASGGVMVRLERTFLRPYEVAPQPSDSAVSFEVEWPSKSECSREQEKANACVEYLKPGRVGNIKITIRSNANTPIGDTALVRIPLPPGVQLAGGKDVRQVQGALYVQVQTARAEQSLLIPVRFTLAGQFTVREATARLLEQDPEPAIARARPLVVKN